MNACRDPADSVSRIMTPALVQSATCSTLATRETIEPSPVSVVYANWKASAVFQMSAPAPLTVNDPPLPLLLPAAPTAPISVAAQPAGTDCAAAVPPTAAIRNT